jgi:Uma2 family endonuclease
MTRVLDTLLHQVPEFRWTVDRYHEAIRMGLFTTADKIELLYGKLVALMPIGSPHSHCVTILAEFFRDRFGKRYTYREEKPLTIIPTASEPQPDVGVVRRRDYTFENPGPSDVYLVAEVADSSLDKDQTLKVMLYAEAGIAEYWIVNLIKRRIEVYLDPLPDESTYGSIHVYGEADRFESPFAGEVVVTNLLPAAIP